MIEWLGNCTQQVSKLHIEHGQWVNQRISIGCWVSDRMSNCVPERLWTQTLTSSDSKTWQHIFVWLRRLVDASELWLMMGPRRAMMTSMSPMSAMYDMVRRAWSIMISWKISSHLKLIITIICVRVVLVNRWRNHLLKLYRPMRSYLQDPHEH